MDLENKFNASLQRSLACIDNSLNTSINFEGVPEMLLIDEFQFLLGAACVTIQPTADRFFGNLLEDERLLLDSWASDHEWKKAIHGSASEALSARRKTFPKLSSSPALAIDSPLRLALGAVNSAYECRLQLAAADAAPCILTVYFEQTHDSPRFWEYPEFPLFVENAIRVVLESFELARHPFTSESEALYRRFSNSSYLISVLDTLQRRIDERLRLADPAFAPSDSPGYFIQFFLVTERREGDHLEHRLRYFPMPDEMPALQDPETIARIKNTLRDASLPVPEDLTKFISEDFLWSAENAFVGYCCDTAASLYLRDWQLEPRARGIRLGADEKQQRAVATIIFQALRGNTPHQFLLPLFANAQVVGVVAINCPHDIDAHAQLLPVRCARDLGYVLTMALETDDVVNRLQEQQLQAAEMRAYKHVTNSLLHSEGAYCMEIQRFLKGIRIADVVRQHPPLEPAVNRLSFIVREKQSLIEEFRSIEDPIGTVPRSFLYPLERETQLEAEEATIPIASLTHLVDTIVALFSPDRIGVTLTLGPALKSYGGIPNFDYFVLARLLANLVKNARSVAQRRHVALRAQGIESAMLDLTVEIADSHGAKSLAIDAIDNCGGFELVGASLPWAITSESWSRYLERAKPLGGMGFFMFARYATASGGVCEIDNVDQPTRGARVRIRIPIPHEVD